MSPLNRFPVILSRAGAALLITLAAACAATRLDLPGRSQIDNALSRLSEITGLPVRKTLRFESITRPEVQAYLETRIKESVDVKDIEREEIALKLIGFVSPDFQLRQTTLALMSEQAAAFYDYHRKALFLASWTPEAMRDTAVVHELAHALADQSFGLEKFTRKVEQNSEKTLAREAVVEGQASYLMLAYAAQVNGRRPLNIRPDTTRFDSAIDPTGGEYPVFDRAPLYLRMSLVFPYTWGTAFQSAVIERLGQTGFREVFRHPPISTQQILHPETYFSGLKPTEPELPRAPRKAKTVVEGDLGELEHQILIRQFVSAEQANQVAPHWRGGRFRIVEERGSHRRVLLYASEWADEQSAAAFLSLYQQCMRGKWKQVHITAQSAQGWSGKSEAGYFRTETVGAVVRSEEGLAEPAALLEKAY